MNFAETLIKAKENGDVVSVFSNGSDPHKCGVGTVEDVDGEYFVIAGISTFGLYGGYQIKRVEDIFRIDVECEYEQEYKALYKARDQKHEKHFHKISDDMLEDFFEWCAENKFVIAVGIREYADTVYGIVSEVDRGWAVITLDEITEKGIKTGKIHFGLDSVYQVCADGSDEQKIDALYKFNNKSDMEE
ncbi:MAG: hypothetical protein J1F63_02125 [Oscillospiraceae bacterium]|nr:hypothetical protein [Oscillospiraceae bacterium]